MDIAAASISLSQSALAQAASIRVLSMAKTQAVQQGNDLVKMLEQSVQPNLGNSIDMKV
jgi:hypothetical protein